MLNYIIYGLYSLADSADYQNIRYVGQTTRTIEDRLADHKRHAKKDENRYVCRWIRTLDYNIGIIVLETSTFVSDQHLDERETYHITEALTAGLRLTNLTDGGRGTRGYIWPEDLVERRSSEGNSFYGRTHTDEVKASISEKAKTRWTDPEYFAQQREHFVNRELIKKIWEGGENHPFWGKHHTDSTKQLLSDAGKKQWENPTPEQKEGARQNGIKASHVRWHVAKRKVNPDCIHCVSTL